MLIIKSEAPLNMRIPSQLFSPKTLTQLHKDAVDVILGHFDVDARVDGVSCCHDVLFDVMMIGDDALECALVTDDVTSEIPRVSEDLSQQFVVGTRRHSVDAENVNSLSKALTLMLKMLKMSTV